MMWINLGGKSRGLASPAPQDHLGAAGSRGCRVLIHVGRDRNVAVDLKLAVWLALAAGAVNAAGFRALGYFSANMTGNVSSLSDFLAIGRSRTALWFLALLLAFVLGAFVSGLLAEAGRRLEIRGIYALAILLEALLLLGLAVSDLAWPDRLGGGLLMPGLSFLMGLQNGATTRISDGRVRSTHVSGIATDIGLEAARLLASPLDRAGGRAQRRVVAARLWLHLSTLGAFFLGGVMGVLGYEALGPVVYGAVAVMLIAVAVPGLKGAMREEG